MFKTIRTLLLILLFGTMMLSMLIMPREAFILSSKGLLLWFNQMIPALLPFMILSGIMVNMKLSNSFAAIFAPVIRPVFRIRNACIYCIVIGFLCGFPMGAKVCAESLENKTLTQKEAQFLLGFCNNLGPIFITGYAANLFPPDNMYVLLSGMYGIPLIYGVITRYTRYREIKCINHKDTVNISKNNFFEALNNSIITSLNAITVLGGYIIFCSLLKLLPSILLNQNNGQMISILIEITGGLSDINSLPNWIVYSMLMFGGLSCIAQTASCIRKTGLSLKIYISDKIIQTLMAMFYYRLFL